MPCSKLPDSLSKFKRYVLNSSTGTSFTGNINIADGGETGLIDWFCHRGQGRKVMIEEAELKVALPAGMLIP